MDKGYVGVETDSILERDIRRPQPESIADALIERDKLLPLQQMRKLILEFLAEEIETSLHPADPQNKKNEILKRRQDVLIIHIKGETNQRIAEQLNLPEQTVANDLFTIRKIIIKKAIARGILPEGVIVSEENETVVLRDFMVDYNE